MALIITVSIICDRCETQFNLTTTTMNGMQLRKIAQQAGWVYHGKDICPNCRVKTKDGKDFKHSKLRAIKGR